MAVSFQKHYKDAQEEELTKEQSVVWANVLREKLEELAQAFLTLLLAFQAKQVDAPPGTTCNARR